MEKKVAKKKEKIPYEKPFFQSEELFETAVLACGKVPPEVGQCNNFPENT